MQNNQKEKNKKLLHILLFCGIFNKHQYTIDSNGGLCLKMLPR